MLMLSCGWKSNSYHEHIHHRLIGDIIGVVQLFEINGKVEMTLKCVLGMLCPGKTNDRCYIEYLGARTARPKNHKSFK